MNIKKNELSNNSNKKSLFDNFIFNFIKTLNSIIFPVITFGYSARILGAEGIGKVNFSKSIITYFTMIAMLGMNYYGTREAAKLRGEPEKLSKFCVEMLVINSISTLLAYGLLAVSMLNIPLLKDYTLLLLICSPAILLQGMGMEWLYQAMEEYRYIALRSTLFQIVALVALPIFVRDENDVVSYALITLIASSGTYIINFFNAQKYFRSFHDRHLNIVKHLKPLLWLFAMSVSIELYTVLDTTMLGFLKGDQAVGFYTAAIKVERMVNNLITSLGVVLIPRLSFLTSQGKNSEFHALIDKGFNYVFMISTPAAVGLFVLADEIILLFSGEGFTSAAVTMRIMAPIVILIPFSVMINQQTLIPMGKEKLILVSTSVGAITNLFLNSFLIPRFAQNGAAIATVISEIVVAIVCFANGNRLFHVGCFFRCYWQYWISSAPIPFVAFIVHSISIHYTFQILLTILISATLYFSLLVVLKNPYICEALKIILDRKNSISG